MMDLTDSLRRILRSVEPSQEEKEGAQRSHRYLRDILVAGQMGSIIRDDFLSGSYRRATAIRPLDDVDVIFVVEPGHWKTSSAGILPDPSAVLQTFKRELERQYPETELQVQRRSIRLQMWHLNVDVVPAVSADGRGSERLRIPDADNDMWIRSAPKLHSALATEINQRQGELFKPLVKLLKTWNLGAPEELRFKSFCVETIATRLFASARLNSLQTGLAQFFDFVCYIGGDPHEFRWGDDRGMSLRLGDCVVPDTAEGMNVAASVTRQGCECFLRRAAASRDRILQAERARTWNAAEGKIEQAFGSHLRELGW
jgi:hypothetical protein